MVVKYCYNVSLWHIVTTVMIPFLVGRKQKIWVNGFLADRKSFIHCFLVQLKDRSSISTSTNSVFDHKSTRRKSSRHFVTSMVQQNSSLPSVLISDQNQNSIFEYERIIPGSTLKTQQKITIQTIQAEVDILNGGEYLNLNSPKQVAAAIFGSETHPTNKSILTKVVTGDWKFPLNENLDGQRLANLVLTFRSLKQHDSKTTIYNVSSNFENQSSTSHNPTESLSWYCNATGEVSSGKVNEIKTVDDIQDALPATNQHNELIIDEIKTESNDYEYDTSFNSITQWGWNGIDNNKKIVEAMFTKSNNKVDIYWKESLILLTKQVARTLLYQLDVEQCPMGYDPLASPYNSVGPIQSFPEQMHDDETLMCDEKFNYNYDHQKLRSGKVSTAGSKGSFLGFCREQKEKYPDCVVLTRCGDFYETFGTDAILLVEHCGLNSMGGKARAGCPVRNVQNTLNCLTIAGYRVAVFEEGADTDSSIGVGAVGGSKSRIKSRFLAQIVSPASPTYLYDLVLCVDAYANGNNALSTSSSPQPRPFVGILSTQSGYTMVEVSIEERVARVSERLTPEAVACRLANSPPSDPLIYVSSFAEQETLQSSSSIDISQRLPFLPSRRDMALTGPGSRLVTKVVPPTLILESANGVCDDVRAKNVIVGELLKLPECKYVDFVNESSSNMQLVSVDDFTLISASSQLENESTVASPVASTQTNPLHLETARQLGLMNDDSIPSLLSYLLPEVAPAATRRFLRRYLLTPPPPSVAESVATLVSYFRGDKLRSPSIPPISIPPIGKVLATLRARQANAIVFGELLMALCSTVMLLDMHTKESQPHVNAALMKVLEYECGMAADSSSLRKRCLQAISQIQEVVSLEYHPNFYVSTKLPLQNDQISNFGQYVPTSFFERNEGYWRGRVQPSTIDKAYHKVNLAATKLNKSILRDFWLTDNVDANRVPTKTPIVHDIFNNLLCLREIPPTIDGNQFDLYFHPKDRNGKLLRNRYTTEAVQEALSEYVDACDEASSCVSAILMQLSKTLHDAGHFPAIVQASHFNLIVATTFFHAAMSRSLGWTLGIVVEDESGKLPICELVDIWPYWIQEQSAVKNTFTLEGMQLLTAPNMSGKSTLMRSTAAAALLTICGLCAPFKENSVVRRFDYLFLRGASSDVPIEKKSAFGAEMADISSLLRCCGSKSLVFVDELGRGTSPRDGTRLSAAILENMAQRGMSGVFATHLHGMFDLPGFNTTGIYPKRMVITNKTENLSQIIAHESWTYKIEDGICLDSMALVTAAQFGLPDSIIARATSFEETSSVSRISFEVEKSSPDENFWSQLVKEVQTVTLEESIRIPPFWNVPAALDGHSSLYVLVIASEPKSVYVGETDKLRLRIKQHRAKGGLWNDLEVIVVVSSDKTQARQWENVLIKRLAMRGYHVLSTSDGRSKR